MRKRNRPPVVRYVLIGCVIFAAAVLVSVLTRMFLVRDFRFSSFSDEQAALVTSIIDGTVGAIAAGFVLYELKVNSNAEERQSDIEEAQFLLEYNQAFIQDEKMVAVEHLLEQWMEAPPSERTDALITDDNRQQFINYLVYLEGLAPLVFRDILKLEHIDDLMAYRFFLATNNRALQDDQLFRYPAYYRGCFKLYSIWKTYRTRRGYEIPLPEYALDLWDEFEKYSESPVTVRNLSLEDDLKKAASLIYDTDPFIYPAAFGNRRRAMRALPEMMRQVCIFHVDNVRAAVIDGNIVGIAVIADASSHLEAPPPGRGTPGEGFADARKRYFSGIAEAVAGVGNSAHLVCLCVDGGKRGQRVGDILLKRVIRECRDRGLSAVTLDVLKDNPVAVSLYKKYGFRETSRGAGYAFGGAAPECLRMTLALDGSRGKEQGG